MLVFGDLKQNEDAAEIVKMLELRLQTCCAMPAGLARHEALVGTFIRASELVQGVADAEFHHIHADEISARQDAGNALLLQLAQAIARSWESGFTATYDWPDPIESQLQMLGSAGAITTKQAEGYAFYALYPESYIAAARKSGLGADTVVIGIRSIGAGLAALVAAGLGAPPAQTVRPHGHPFDRRLSIGDALAERLLGGNGAIAIVDEGPGLSGSSFNGVADWLVEHGIEEHRIHFFPSHGGALGHAAQAAHRERWARASRHHVDFDALVVRASNPAHRLQSWAEGATGDRLTQMKDVSGGGWRGLSKGGEDLPADPAMEKRKFLLTGGRGKWIAKFSGLGNIGENKLHLAEALGKAGFLPQPATLAGGFLVLPWIGGETGAENLVPPDRILQYLALRAGMPPAGNGADLAELFEATIFNIGKRHGEEAASAVRSGLGDPGRFSLVRCCTDNRMQRWEWRQKDGHWYKFDSLDHHAAHDLVGCQDIAWDLAGACVELDLSPDEQRWLATELGTRLEREFDPAFLQAIELCYLGFQTGLWSMARDRNNEEEAVLIDGQLQRYDQRLAKWGIGMTCVKS